MMTKMMYKICTNLLCGWSPKWLLTDLVVKAVPVHLVYECTHVRLLVLAVVVAVSFAYKV